MTFRSASAGPSEAISPTAHYTGYAWLHHGLGFDALTTAEGRLFYQALRVPNALSAALGGPTLDGLLLARHQVIDELLTRAIEDGRVSQVLEVAAGLSPRGLRFTRRYGDRIRYVEADLPRMAARKRRLLAAARAGTPRVAEVDALADHGPRSLAGLADSLSADRGTAIITEGLLSYLAPAQMAGLWRRIAGVLGRFPQGLYLSDLHLAGDNSHGVNRTFGRLLSVFVRGRVHFHRGDPDSVAAQLVQAGFAQAVLHRPEDFRDRLRGFNPASARLVRILEARTALPG